MKTAASLTQLLRNTKLTDPGPLGVLGLGAAGTAVGTAAVANAARNPTELVASLDKNVADNNATMLNELVTKGPTKGTSSRFLGAGERSALVTGQAFDNKQTSDDTGAMQSKGFSPVAAAAIARAKALGRARQAIQNANEAQLVSAIDNDSPDSGSGELSPKDFVELRDQLADPQFVGPRAKALRSERATAAKDREQGNKRRAQEAADEAAMQAELTKSVSADLESQIAADDAGDAEATTAATGAALAKGLDAESGREEVTVPIPDLEPQEPAVAEQVQDSKAPKGSFRPAPRPPPKPGDEPPQLADADPGDPNQGEKPPGKKTEPPKPAVATTDTPPPAADTAALPTIPWYKRPWARNTGFAAAGVGALGLLAYLIMDRKKVAKRRRPAGRRRLAVA